MSSLSDYVSIIGGGATGIGVIFGGIFKGIPWLKQRKISRTLKIANEEAIRDVIIGRPGGRPNAITGEAGRPPLPGISERLNEMFGNVHELQESQSWQVKKLQEIEQNVKNSTEIRIVRLEEIVTELSSHVKHILNVLKPEIKERMKNEDH